MFLFGDGEELTSLLGSVGAQKTDHSVCSYNSKVSIPDVIIQNQPNQRMADRAIPGPVSQTDSHFLSCHDFRRMKLLNHRPSSGSMCSVFSVSI